MSKKNSIATMDTLIRKIGLSLCFLLIMFKLNGQSIDEQFQQVEQRLHALSYSVPGLKETLQLSVSGVSIQEFVRALAEANGLNINIDGSIQHQVVNNFRGETAINILLFLSRTYHLDINVIGSIMSITKMKAAPIILPFREVNASYQMTEGALSYELQNDTLASVARKLSSISGKNIVVPLQLQQKLVSGYMLNAPFDVALEKLAYANNLRFYRTNDDVYVFESLLPGEELFINDERETAVRYRGERGVSAEGSGGARMPNGSEQVSNKGTYTVYKRGNTGSSAKRFSIQANNASIADLVKRASDDAGVDYLVYADLQGQVSANVKDIDFDDFLLSIFQGTSYTFRFENGVYLIGDRKVEGLRASRIIHVQNRAIDTLVKMIPMEWMRDVEIKEFSEQNMLLLFGSDPQIREIEKLIKELDRLVPMVLIEVTMIDIQKGKVIETGISAILSDTTMHTGGSLLSGLDFTFGTGSINRFLSQLGTNNSYNLGKVSPNFYLKLKALEENENVELRSVPKLSTLNGHKASLSIGSTRYYRTETQNVIPSLQTQTIFTEQFTPIEANLTIEIRPVVSADEQITLNIKVDISDFVGVVAENRPPPTSTSKFESIVRAKNEDTIMLGGIERTETSDSGRGVPVLSRIPVLRWLFSSKEKRNKKIVSIVFIKPTIIH